MRPSLPGGRVVAGKTWKEGAKEAEGDGVPVAMRKDGGANWPFAPALEGGGSVDILRAESTECIRRCGEDPPPPREFGMAGNETAQPRIQFDKPLRLCLPNVAFPADRVQIDRL